MTPLPSFLHDLPVEAHLGMWGLVLPALGAGLAFAWLASPKPDRLRRACLAAGPALLVVLALLVLPRLVQLLHPDFGGGPQRWLHSVVEVFLGDQLSLRPLHAYDTAVLEHGLLSVLMILVLPVFALLHRIRPPRDKPALPLAWPTATVLGFFGLFVPFLIHRALVEATLVPGLELVAAGSVAGLLLAIRAVGAWLPLHSGTREISDREVRRSTPDVRQAWIRAGVLDPEAQPRFLLPDTGTPTQDVVPQSPRAARAWAAAGAHGSPPVALDRLLDDGDVATWLVGDLPPHTERALLDAFLADLDV